jgi:hypothetical protein
MGELPQVNGEGPGYTSRNKSMPAKPATARDVYRHEIETNPQLKEAPKPDEAFVALGAWPVVEPLGTRPESRKP